MMVLRLAEGRWRDQRSTMVLGLGFRMKRAVTGDTAAGMVTRAVAREWYRWTVQDMVLVSLKERMLMEPWPDVGR